MRCLFYAISLSNSERLILSEMAGDLTRIATKGRWTRPENYHLTLQFMGNIEDDQIQPLTRILERAANGCDPFELETQSAGVFGQRRDILWIGTGPCQTLDNLVQHLTELLAQAGMPHETRSFTPHITVGRNIRLDPIHLAAWQVPKTTIHVRSVTLMESCLIDQRRCYRPLATRNLI